MPAAIRAKQSRAISVLPPKSLWLSCRFWRERGNDCFEARNTAQRIPARIEMEIAVGNVDGDFRQHFQFFNRQVALAGPRVNPGQVSHHLRAKERILGNWNKLDCMLGLADGLLLAAKAG